VTIASKGVAGRSPLEGPGRRTLGAAAALVVTLVVVACGDAPAPSGAAGPIPGVRGDGTLPPPPRPTWGSQRGITLVTYSSAGYGTPQAGSYLRQIRAVGAEWVQLDPTWYQADAGSNEIAAAPQTPADRTVERAVHTAHQAGLKVLLKPVVDVAPGGSVYRGKIKPTDRAAWFASYTAFVSHYAGLATRTKVDEFSVGAELAGVSGDREAWLPVVSAVRARYRGPVLYAANFDEYRHVAFWDQLDLIGIDAYWPLAHEPTTDVTALRAAWRPIRDELREYADRAGRRILFAEAGYTSQHGTTTAPWSWTVSRTQDQAEQAAAYEALLRTFDDQSWWAGVFWWAWDVPLADSSHIPLGYTPHGKTAEKVIRRWWD
jgi:hypothetical protein